MTELVVQAQNIQVFCEERCWRFCFIGGLAVQHWGEQRFTKDVDMSLLTGFGGEETFIDALLERYQPRFPEARSFALQNRVLLLKSPDGVPFDVSLGAIPFEEEVVQRSVKVPYTDTICLRICTAEDLIVFKAFACREIDWHDVKSVIIRQKNEINWDYIWAQLTPLAEIKEDEQILKKLKGYKNAISE